MIKSNGLNKIRIAVFISGKGSNFKNLINSSNKRNSKFQIGIVVSSNSNAEGLKYSKKFKIKKIINSVNTNLAEKILISKLKNGKVNIKIVLLHY